MKKPLFYLIITISTLLIGFLIFGNPFSNSHHQPLNQKEMQKLSKSFGDKFAEMRGNQQKAQANNSKDSQLESIIENSTIESQNTQAIIGVIYNKQDSTWFIKAKDNQKRINQITDQFKQYFLTDLKFDENHKPQFNHLPKGSKIVSQSSMRYATFIIEGVEISVINLSGEQDTFSNVKRWMKQIGLDDNSPISMEFLDDKKTIYVRMPK